ncbi:MAG: AraC family transcriptional regulator [Deltaproteobacteria bacterium]|nr:AraC family transcriptional regulator [Deltaproteobacteria bacterium]
MLVDVSEDVTRLRLPEAGFVLGIRHRGAASIVARGGETRLPSASLTGVAGVARRMRTVAGGAVVLARFRPGGAARVFAEPLHLVGDAVVALEDLVPRRDVDRLRQRIAEARDDHGRVEVLETFFTSRLRSEASDPFVAHALEALDARPGGIRIKDLARELGISQDVLERRFRRVVGATPKQLASLLRLRRAIDAHRHSISLSRLAVEAGYFDQSHFNRELRAITGETPSRFFRRIP